MVPCSLHRHENPRTSIKKIHVGFVEKSDHNHSINTSLFNTFNKVMSLNFVSRHTI